MTSTVTVAPLTISTWGGCSAPVATGLMSLPISVFIAVDDAFLRDADQDDWLLVVDELDAPHHALRVDADQEVDRLARVADRIREIRVQVDVAEQPIPAVRRHEGRVALRRPKRSAPGKTSAGCAFGRNS